MAKEVCLQSIWVGGREQKDAEVGGKKELRRFALGFSLGKEERKPWRTEAGALTALLQ